MNTFIDLVRTQLPIDKNTIISAINGATPLTSEAIKSVATRAFALLALVATVTIGSKMLYDRLNIKSILFNTAAITTLTAVALFSCELFKLTQGATVDTALLMNAAYSTQAIMTAALQHFIKVNF